MTSVSVSPSSARASSTDDRRWTKIRGRLRPPKRSDRTIMPVAGPADPRRQLALAVLVIVSTLSASFLLHLLVVSSLQQDAAQERAFDAFRSQLAQGTAPIGPTDTENRMLSPGTPVALLEIPALDVEQVVAVGTSSAVLLDGPGLRRDSVLPGQIGTSVVLGRRAAYGGPFARLADLESGDAITVTTGQGTFEYEVLGVRHEGDPLPPPVSAGAARLLLATAGGSPFLPEGILRVDADLVGEPVVGQPPLVRAAGLLDSEQMMGTDTSTLWSLVLWLQALALTSVAAVWAWLRWSRPHAWVIFAPPLLLIGLAAAGEVTRLLPNLM